MQISFLPFAKFHGRDINTIGSSVIRAKWITEKWEDAKIWTTGQKFDVLILQKVYWEQMINDFKGIKILDLCDPDWLNGDVKIAETMKKVDHVTTSTEDLAKYLGQMTDTPITVIPDRLNMDYFTEPKEHIERARNVVWFGYYHNAKQVLNTPVLQSLKIRGLDLTVVSNAEFEPQNDMGINITNINWTPENAYMDIKGGDFAINPPSISRGFRFKSNNKTLISWALGLPVANTADEMDRFLDPEERTKEIKKRLNEIKKDYMIEKSINQYKDIIKICTLNMKKAQ